MKHVMLFILLLVSLKAISAPLYQFDDRRQEAQFRGLLTELRCLVCQNQDLADSNAGLAQDLRNDVYGMVKNGKTDNEIVQFLTARYGDFILFKPPLKAITALLWFGPGLFLALGVFIFWRTCLKRI